jgi:hypothetical protein
MSLKPPPVAGPSITEGFGVAAVFVIGIRGRFSGIHDDGKRGLSTDTSMSLLLSRGIFDLKPEIGISCIPGNRL